MDDSNHQLGIGVGRIDRRSATKQKKIGEALETTGMYICTWLVPTTCRNSPTTGIKRDLLGQAEAMRGPVGESESALGRNESA